MPQFTSLSMASRDVVRRSPEVPRKPPLRRSVSGGSETEESARDVVAYWASAFFDQTFFEGLRLAVGGGLQMWTTISRLSRRNLGLEAWAVGYGHVDHALPHAHPHSLVTMLSLLYAPRSRALLVGASKFRETWSYPARYPRGEQNVQRFVVGSCAVFDADSPYAQLLGKEMTDFLFEEHVVGDFLGVFITAAGRLVEPYAPSMTVSHIPSADLRELSKRDDTIVLLAAAGGHKVRLIRLVLEAGLCNTLITDSETAYALLGIEAREAD
jgi:hypothetical protein